MLISYFKAPRGSASALGKLIMDLLAKTQIGIRKSVRANIYKATLQPGILAVFGLILGTTEQRTFPIFDTSLVSCSHGNNFSLMEVSRILSLDLPLCSNLGVLCKADPLAIFTAWDESFNENRNQRLGQLVDITRKLKLPYLAIFPTNGGEAIWRTSIYFANRFPHDPIPYIKLGRRSELPDHNSRRIKAMWKQLKETTCDAS